MEYSTRTRPELIKLCKDRGLSGAGTTEDLIERLQAQDAELAEQGQVDDDPLADDDEQEVDEPVTDTSDEGTEPAAEPVASTSAAQPETRVPQVVAAERSEQATEDKAAADQSGRADPAVKDGRTGKVFRREFYPTRTLDDGYHAHLIAETHHAAHAAGLRTKGGLTVGHRVAESVDAAGKPTVVYEVYVATEKPQHEGRRQR
jgi:hypothetical protein